MKWMCLHIKRGVCENLGLKVWSIDERSAPVVCMLDTNAKKNIQTIYWNFMFVSNCACHNKLNKIAKHVLESPEVDQKASFPLFFVFNTTSLFLEEVLNSQWRFFFVWVSWLFASWHWLWQASGDLWPGDEYAYCIPNPKHVPKYTKVKVWVPKINNTSAEQLVELYFYPIKSLVDPILLEYVDMYSLPTGYLHP